MCLRGFFYVLCCNRTGPCSLVFVCVLENFFVPSMHSYVCYVSSSSNVHKTFFKVCVKLQKQDFDSFIVGSSNTSCLEAYAGFFKLLMKGIFDPYVL